MENVLGPFRMNEAFDLKGSTVNREAKSVEGGMDTDFLRHRHKITVSSQSRRKLAAQLRKDSEVCTFASRLR
jgi:hypothetical protein